ncbi:protein of unknown function [Streptomyces murinus]
MVGAGAAGDVVHEGGVGGAAQFIGDEVLGLADEVDGEGAHRLALFGELPGGDRGHGGGVEAAGEQGAAGHVGDELAAHDVVQQGAHGGDGGVAVVLVRAGLKTPVDAGGQSGAVDGDDGAGLHLAHAVPDGVPRGLDHHEQFAQSVEGHPGAGQRVGEDRLGFGAEQDAVGRAVVVERLDAHAVADHHELVAAAVPDGERVHAVEAFGERVAPFDVGVQDHLGVGVGGEPVAAVGQFAAQLGEVVGLPGVDQRDRALGGREGHRLAAAGQVDDGEPAVAQGGGPLGPGAAVVRAAAGHRLGHRMQCGGLGAEVTVEGHPSGDAAHALPPASGRPAGAALTCAFVGAAAPADEPVVSSTYMTSVRLRPAPVNADVTRPTPFARWFRPRFASARSGIATPERHRRREPAMGKKFPKQERAAWHSGRKPLRHPGGPATGAPRARPCMRS